ncbi:hypothetical protein Sya03_16500 [Spirilliplanes yamanashiensis]|uniref:Uncharacterized protein n=1 Tax=Spirilliplanes yamanashiensis TaxID=42233 RepID=A0A8J3Y5T4_9ACTN|nr:hypothetical protein Sya03_16500 [Spirilliplanes yamanashiensis]
MIGTGRTGDGALAGYEPVAAGRNSQVPTPLRRQWAASSPVARPRTNPSSATAASTFARVASGTVSGRISTFETVPVDTPMHWATSTSLGPGARAAPLAAE